MTADPSSIEAKKLTDESIGTHGEHWTAKIENQPLCPSCGVVKEGQFCSSCGQRFLEKRLTFWPLVRESFSKVTDLNRGLLHTLIWMFRDPGKVAKDYISGRQREYVSPLTYFLIGAALQIFAYWLIQDGLQNMLASRLTEVLDQQKELRPDQLAEAKAFFLSEAFLGSFVTTLQQAYTYAALLCFALPFSFLLWILHRLAGEKFNLGETLVFAMFVFGQVLILTACLTPIVFMISPALQAVLMLAYTIVPQLAHSSFFRRSWRARMVTLSATGLAFIPFSLSFITIFAVTLWIKSTWG